MYYVLFSHKGKTATRDYREFQNEDQAFNFLVDNIKTIFVDKIIESLTELKFGLTMVKAKVGEAPDPEKTEEEEIEEFKAAGEELDQEIIDAEIIRKNKEALKMADTAIKHAAEDQKSDKKLEWKTCPKCKVNRVAPWSKHEICSKCRRPKGKRAYDMSKRRKAKE